ncbi:flagellar hook-associated protein 1 FlgK [Herbaspirillum sp. Sphag1AN]|uniref:flagellar hook-associated protein FlgK n=1 Tax=unclassified Herbaspirillum TaxID=2624150 RepID=UPI001618FF08|nr:MULTISPECIES: flagellar hook-associated protein FlgK [unclassified Herbaspirillum]MBB3211027.1 flagellar hook-associated protein 1 FlgK [Herbaspirillum sp. Sphag1AN]MBB3244656.1 flagellar hook-associated protein 1 FlgK [Herbaspirillum sp. Sphag64]
MTSNIFSIGQSALAAAQTAQATTSHNISNATTPGYNRQVVVQTTAGAINYGPGFVGQGTNVAEIKRIYDNFLAKQVMASQTAASSMDSYSEQIGQINNLVADTSAGLSPSLQSFFSSLQNLASTPNNDAARQAVLSNGQGLVSRFQSLNDQLAKSRSTVNNQIVSNVDTINAFARQIQTLNLAIQKASGATGATPNDLLDQRDQALADLNKIVKVTTVRQDNGSLSVFVGNGQPLVLGDTVSTLAATPSPNDPTRLQISYQTNGQNVLIPDGAFTGGSLGGALQYRSETLDQAQNSLGRVAIALSSSFNAQHKLGQDQNGNMGTDFFKVAPPVVYSDIKNSAGSTLPATITDASKLTTSDYTLNYDGSKYTFTRLSDGQKTVVDSSAIPAGKFPVTIDGVTYAAPTMSAGDSFRIKPTVAGAALIGMAIDKTQLVAAGTPVLTSGNAVTNMGLVTTGNTGTGVVTSATVDKASFTPNAKLDFKYDAATGSLSLSPPAAVTVTTTSGVTQTYAAGTAIPYSAGATISSGGVSFVLSGTPADGDSYRFSPVPGNSGLATISSGSIDSTYKPLPEGTKLGFTFNGTTGQFKPSSDVGPVLITHQDGSTTNYASGAPINFTAGDKFTTAGISFRITGVPADGDQFYVESNTDGVNDNRNAQALNALQTASTIGTASFQGSYSQLVSEIGNRTNEINVTNAAEKARLTSIQQEQQSQSGVNQDEELSNMIKNQTAYQAAAKVIQAASDMLNVLFNIEH